MCKHHYDYHNILIGFHHLPKIIFVSYIHSATVFIIIIVISIIFIDIIIIIIKYHNILMEFHFLHDVISLLQRPNIAIKEKDSIYQKATRSLVISILLYCRIVILSYFYFVCSGITFCFHSAQLGHCVLIVNQHCYYNTNATTHPSIITVMQDRYVSCNATESIPQCGIPTQLMQFR